MLFRPGAAGDPIFPAEVVVADAAGVEIAPIDQSHLDRSISQPPGGVQTAKAAAHDDDSV